MIMCLYIAGTLFVSDGQTAISIGPNTSMELDEHTISIQVSSTQAKKFQLDMTYTRIEEFLWQCDQEATKAVMERSW